MNRLISEQQVLMVIDSLKANFTCYDFVTLDEVASHVKAIPSAEPTPSDEEMAMQYQRGYIDGFHEGKATFEPKTVERTVSRYV